MDQPSKMGKAPSMLQSFWQYLRLEWFRQVGEALLIAFLIITFLFTTVGVVGTSDLPNLQPGERVFIPKYQTWLQRFGLHPFRRGDLVVVKPPLSSPYAVQAFPVLGFSFHPFFIKRLVGLPGDRIRLERGQLFINGIAIDEVHTVPYWRSLGQLDEGSRLANSELWPFREGQTGEFTVPLGMYFVMGDNRSVGGSEDSRDFGPVALSQIGGRASFMLWPPLKREQGQWKLNWHKLETPQGFRAIGGG